ncbi:MAG: hypothetical protein VB100_07440, partial [Angelakisella sp.]|nr:hypothetical protein [Angelakisella sp.]
LKKQIRISSHRKSSDLLFGFRIQFALTLGSQFVFMTTRSLSHGLFAIQKLVYRIAFTPMAVF